jgi:hypothetical protein
MRAALLILAATAAFATPNPVEVSPSLEAFV